MALLEKAQSFLSRPIIPGGIFQPIKDSLEGALELTGSIVGGIGNFISESRGAAGAAISMFSSFNSSEGLSDSLQEGKVGRSANVQYQARDNSPFGCNLNDVEVPCTNFTKVTQQAGQSLR